MRIFAHGFTKNTFIMEAVVNNKPSVAEMYMSTLRTLTNDIKLELISLLSSSMLESKTKIDNHSIDLYHCFKGNWGNDMGTEEYCKMLRNEGVNVLSQDE